MVFDGHGNPLKHDIFTVYVFPARLTAPTLQAERYNASWFPARRVAQHGCNSTRFTIGVILTVSQKLANTCA